MDDVAPELWEQIEKRFRASVEEDDEIAQILKKIEKRTATHMESQRYAIRIGKHSAESLQDILVPEVLPDGKMYYNIAERTIRPAMELNREMILQTSTEIQEILNANAGIGMKAVEPDANEDRIEGIINRTCAEENFDSIKWILKAPIEAFAQSIVDDFIHANAEAQYRAGLHPKITRTLRGKGCKKCRELAGTYDYPDGLPEENVFMRHDNCKCLVTYDPGDGRRQNVHTKRWYEDQSAAASDRNSYLGNIKRRGEPTVEDLKRRLRVYGKDPKNGGVIIEKILNHEISMELSPQGYLKHVEGTKKFEEYAKSRLKEGKGYQSRITISKEETQKLLYAFAGTGEYDTTKSSVIEYVSVGRIIGDYYSTDGKWIPTDKIMIIYKKKSAHIVPIKEYE